MYITIDSIKGNCVYSRSAVVDLDSYNKESQAILLRGEELETAWDDNGEPIEWECISEEDFDEVIDEVLYDRFIKAANGRDIVNDATMDELRGIYYDADKDISKIDFELFADEVASRI